MDRLRNLTRAVVAIVLLLAAGTVFAETVNPGYTASDRARAPAAARVGQTAPVSTRGPSPTPSAGAVAAANARSLTDSQAATLVETLRAAGTATTIAEVRALAAKVGAGDVIHVLALSTASGKTPAQIIAMRAAGKGWGEIAHDLGQSPEVGSVVSNGHNKGQTKPKPLRTPKR